MVETHPGWRKALLQRSSATIGDAIAALDRSGLQIVLAADADGVLEGTITDGDIRRGLLRGDTLESSIDGIIQRSPMVAPSDLPEATVRQLMSANKIRQMPIIDDSGVLVGLYIPDMMGAAQERPNLMVIMAGGKGTRLRPHTQNCPKPLLEVSGKPMLEHILENARASGITNFVVSVHYLGHMIEEYFGDGSKWGVSIDYVREETPLGTGGSLSLLQERPRAPFLVCNGDVISSVNFAEVVDYHNLHRAVATMAVRSHEMRNEFGVVLTDGVEITGFEEKPVVKSYVNAGIYVIDPSALDLLETNAYCDMPTLFGRIRDRQERTVVFPMHEDWLDVGRPDDLARADQTITG
ncbi:nucleotidyltransferase family protein [Parerythrobacter jejuensis]|uniref:NTP transferase domain-containing protein n=1 Tax=Parerythrobacter jejuensis TaxID=795812 RepID=A0A845APQ7_9SPHN|nr:nucleotidyltransferase family protein [Parerythrobacter jejuensis]MXP30885.1 NTP transferase domain-containing protein [Parerythrobacter jejuensis]MXP33645.1 NTP transferase domain-containing protein [Parerythrobacter jejuensis]